MACPLLYVALFFTNNNHYMLVGEEASEKSRPSGQPREHRSGPSKTTKHPSVRRKGGKKGGEGRGGSQLDAGKIRGGNASAKGMPVNFRAPRSKGQPSGRGQPKKQNATVSGTSTVPCSANKPTPTTSTKEKPGRSGQPKKLNAVVSSQSAVDDGTAKPMGLPSAGGQTGGKGQHINLVASFSIDSFEILSSETPMDWRSEDVVAELKSLKLR